MALGSVSSLVGSVSSTVVSPALDELGRAWQAGWRVPDRREIFEWAAENVYLPAGVYAEGGGGLFDWRRSRYLCEPFRALRDDRVRVVTVQFPVRSGKTLIGDIWLPWTLCNAPGPFMWNMNTDTLARRHCRTRALPVLLGVPMLADLLPTDPRQRTGQEIIFRNGVPFYIQCPSIDNLQGVGVRYLLEDELWTRDAGRHEQAVGRLGDYEKISASKLLNAGQGGIEGDDADEEFKAGSQEEWMVPCLDCGKFFEPRSTGYREDRSRWGLVWGSVRPDGTNTAMDERGNWIKARVMESVRFVCPHCNYEHTQCGRAQEQWNRCGEYRALNPNAPASHRSFHLFGAMTRAWHLLAADLSRALNAYRGGIVDPLMIYTQKRDALPWCESASAVEVVGKVHEIRSPEQAWPDEVARVLTVDHQQGGVNWAFVSAVGRNGELRRLSAYKKCISDSDIRALQLEWKVPDGRVCVDCAFETKLVWAWCVKYGWTAFWGDKRKSFVHLVGKKSNPRRVQRSYSKPVDGDPEIGTTHAGRRFAKVIYWSNPTVKAGFQRMLAAGKVLEPDLTGQDAQWEEDYRTQMKGQKRRLVKNRITGRVSWEDWDNGNDHACDCWNMASAAFRILRALPDMEPEEGAIRTGEDGEEGKG